jgi:1,2-diacylglycerol 3-alpha-glucosyltransferase
VITKTQIGLPAEAVVAVYVGRMSSEKSIDRLLQLFHYVAQEEPSVYLLLVGGGPELMELRGLVANLGLAGRVRFTGGVPYKYIPAYLHASDFFVSASLSEVHPLTFIEAAAAGLPGLGFRSTGIQDIIVDEQTGLIAEDNDLSFGLRFLRLAQDPELRARLGCSAAEYARKLSVENNARRLLELYRELRAR